MSAWSDLGDGPVANAARRAHIRFIAEHDRYMDVEASSAALADIGATTEIQNRAYTKLAAALLKRETYLPGSRNVPSCCTSRADADAAVRELDVLIAGCLAVLVPNARQVAA